MKTLLDVRLTARYGEREVLHEVAFQVGEGEVLGLAGPSGCGKSTCALAVLGLLGLKGGAASGSIRFGGQELLTARPAELRALRGKEISFIPQSPIASLNPALRIGAMVREAWYVHAPRGSDWRGAAAEAFRAVSLPDDAAFLERRPNQLSVGQAQRVLAGMAILHKPRLLVADEPTSALDPITQVEILRLFADLTRQAGVAMLYVSHDLLSMAQLCHRVAILHEGQVVETGPVERVFSQPQHPYAKALLATLPPGVAAAATGAPAPPDVTTAASLAGLSEKLLEVEGKTQGIRC